MSTTLTLSCLLWHLLFIAGLHHQNQAYAAGGGQWTLVQNSIGIAAMHMQLLNNDRVVIFDRTDFGLSNISLPSGKCRNDSNEMAVKIDCTAHSVEYDVLANSVRPLMVQTDVWCSSGAVAVDGHLIQTGGFNDGDHVIRTFYPCGNCDWNELALGLLARRCQTNDAGEENNLYPFVHLNVDGNLFIFANNRAILLDYTKNVVVRTYPSFPGGDPRNYPSTGSSVLLPLNLGQPSTEAEVLICGGAPRGSYGQAKGGKFVAALNSCGRIKINDKSPTWATEIMPLARVMGDMILLPNGHVLVINGAAAGTAGWEYGRDPVLSPVLYQPDNPIGSRFEIQNPSTVPRVYHSTAILLRDGRILVGGSNPHVYYNFTGVLYPTELRLETFSPTYLGLEFNNLRPKIVSPNSQFKVKYGQKVVVRFSVPGALSNKGIAVTMVAPSFTTHSFSMNQRLLVLGGGKSTLVGSTYQVEITMPNLGIISPPGYYLLFVVHQDIPSEGIWIQIQ
ncbi:hypothetical protein IFM89_002912 [Coptis chinensis]|uniref:Galactose oxidase n=1 Tax=Coptis chinensis TaxID=261450 RepID=A0A835IME8_9MAGN|nr:hypothetical protein IFM89_002912 [Coptis chinensis]